VTKIIKLISCHLKILPVMLLITLLTINNPITKINLHACSSCRCTPFTCFFAHIHLQLHPSVEYDANVGLKKRIIFSFRSVLS
jgi:hypothetical protein